MKKLIRFRRLSRKPETRNIKVRMGGVPTLGIPTRIYNRPFEVVIWETAFSEAHLFAKLDGEMAEIVMPGKSWIVRLYRYFFPLKGLEMKVEQETS